MSVLLVLVAFIVAFVFVSRKANAYGTTSVRYPRVHFASNPEILRVRKGAGVNTDNINTGNISIRNLVETRCKSLFTEFNGLWWLFNGHLQTLYCVMGNFSKDDHVWYHRTYLRLADGGTLGLDFAPPDQSKLKDDTPIVVVQHGLTGGSYEAYIRAIVSRVCIPVEDGGLGYRAIVINFRGCAGVPVTSPMLYSAGHTDDTRQALMYIGHLFPNAPILGLGFSLGANILTRYLGEEGRKSRVHSACVLSCPWDLRQNNEDLLKSFTGKHIYATALGGNLKALLKRHIHAFMANQGSELAQIAKEALKLKNPTLAKFDHEFSRRVSGPSHIFPFPDVEAYYIYFSSHTMVNKVTVPFLTINAADDPVVRYVPLSGGENGNVVMVLTKGGGHLGWFEAGSGYVDRWTTKPVIEWLTMVGQDLVLDSSRDTPRLYVDRNGYLREEGREELGCKFIERGGLVD